MKSTALDYMHRLLAESLYRGHSGRKPNHEEATRLAARSVQWFRELLLRLSIQGCIEQADPIAAANTTATGGSVDGELAQWPGLDQLDAIRSQDEAIWDALCEGRLVLRIQDGAVNASIIPKPQHHVLH